MLDAPDASVSVLADGVRDDEDQTITLVLCKQEIVTQSWIATHTWANKSAVSQRSSWAIDAFLGQIFGAVCRKCMHACVRACAASTLASARTQEVFLKLSITYRSVLSVFLVKGCH